VPRSEEDSVASKRKLERLFGQAVERHMAGDLAGAEALYREILRGDRKNVATLINLAIVLKEEGAFERAEKALRKALTIEPDRADAYSNLGTVLESLGRADDAAACYRRALALKSDYADAHNNMGNLLRANGHYGEAIACYRRAIDSEPDHVQALDNLGDALQAEGSLAEASRCYAQAHATRPSYALSLKQGLMLPPIYHSQAELEAVRARFLDNLARLAAAPEAIADPLREVNRLPFYLAYQGYDEAATMRMLARVFRPSLPERTPARPSAALPAPGARRIGFLSSFWSNHSVGSCFLRLLPVLAADGFETVLIDCSAAPQDDPALATAGDRRVLLPRGLAAARQTVADLHLDILVYADIGFDPFTYYLASTRLAPVQCALPGHPLTSGIDTVDYHISADFLETDEADARYSERLIRLNWFPSIWERPQPPAETKGRIALGLPNSGALYLAPMLLFKIQPAFDAAIAGILRADPSGFVVLFEDRYSPRLGQDLRTRLKDSVGSQIDRVRFLPYLAFDDFLCVLQHGAAALDTFPFGGATTLLAALAVGTPIVTKPSEFTRGRVGQAFYRAMGVDGCVAQTVDDYVKLAVQLGTDNDYRARVSAQVLERCGVLFDNPTGAKSLAAFFSSLPVAEGRALAKAS
jgi:predicted O-linked N-acetylglucosamine transferase (SPINDLY family)